MTAPRLYTETASNLQIAPTPFAEPGWGGVQAGPHRGVSWQLPVLGTEQSAVRLPMIQYAQDIGRRLVSQAELNIDESPSGFQSTSFMRQQRT